MSTFLASYFDTIPLGYSVTQMQNVIVGNLTTNGWQLLAQSDGVYSDLIPPSTESIGTAKFREVVRIYFPDNTTIGVGSYQECIADAYPQSFRLTAKTAGAVAAAVTINSVTVTGATGSSSSTANDNLRALFYALKDSVDAAITDWDFWYDGTANIVATRKTIAAAQTISVNSYVTYTAMGSPVFDGATTDFARISSTLYPSVTVDLTNGFVYYMSVFERSFLLGTKCLSGSYGAIFASYIDHQMALDLTPDSTFCTPIELIVGIASNSGLEPTGRPTHWWSVPSTYGVHAASDTGSTYANQVSDYTKPDWHTWTGAAYPYITTDCPLGYTTYGGVSYTNTWNTLLAFRKGGLDTGSSSDLDALKIASGISPRYTIEASYQKSVRFTEPFPLPDVFAWIGSEANETCALAYIKDLDGLNAGSITLQQAVDDTTAYSTLTLSSTTGIPSQGGFVIGIESFTYTGISGATVTGVARAQNGTVKARHFVGDAINFTSWFMKLNYSALMCGASKPS